MKVHMINELRKKIKQNLRNLWDQRLEDRHIAEDTARRPYKLLDIEKGTVIKATRDYLPPDLNTILKMYESILGVKLTDADTQEGGWGKFVRETLTKQPRWRAHGKTALKPQEKRNGPPKKGGRGWLHRT